MQALFSRLLKMVVFLETLLIGKETCGRHSPGIGWRYKA